jgi:hypothetical protein
VDTVVEPHTLREVARARSPQNQSVRFFGMSAINAMSMLSLLEHVPVAFFTWRFSVTPDLPIEICQDSVTTCVVMKR